MRAILFALIVIAIGLPSRATNYYFSSSDGNDSRTKAQASNPATPWKTLEKLNSIFSTLSPGDSVLFKRGDTFYGSLTITKSGTSSSPVVLSTYGTGAKPIISGLTSLTTWVSKGGGIYESSTVLPNSSLNLVLLNDEVQEMGRYPNSSAANKGFLFFESHDGFSSITDDELSSSPNWKDAELVVRCWKSAIDRATITSHKGGKLSAKLSFEPHDGFGYFIQNDIRTLDSHGEWYYNPTTHKLSMFLSKSPTSYKIKVGVIDTLVYASDRTNVTIDGLSFQGSHQMSMLLRYCSNIRITDCDFLNSGDDAMLLTGSSNLTITGCSFNHSLSNAIDVNIAGNNWTISDNIIQNTGMFEGLSQKGDDMGYAIYSRGDNHTIERNTVDSVGYCAIRFSGNNILIKNNVITYFNMTKNDGGAIYSWEGSKINRKIIGNIIMHGIGANEGLGMDGSGSSATGIYFDNNVSGVEILSNTVADCSKTGIYVHNSYGIKIRDNTFFDNLRQLMMTHDNIAPEAVLRNLDVRSNILFAKTPDQGALGLTSSLDDLEKAGVIDSNYYCRPTNENFINLATYVNSNAQKVSANYDLADWQDAFPYDKHSQKTTRTVPTYIINSLSGKNKVVNGDFDSDIDNMYSSNGSSWLSSKLTGGTYQGIVSATNSLFQVIPSIGEINTSKNYILRFSAQATKDTVISVYLRQSGSPYTTLSEVKQVKIGPTRQEYEFLFSQPQSFDKATLMFAVRGKNFKFWLDNISLQEANVTMLDLDKLIRFEYNPTNSLKTVRLLGKYYDVKNKSYTTSVTLQPYTSVILLKDDASAAADSASLLFAQTTQSSQIEQGATQTISNDLSTSDDIPVSAQLKALDKNGKVPSWLTLNGKTLNKVSFTTGSKISFDVNTSGLATGTYSAQVTASASDYKSDVLDITLNVMKEGTASAQAEMQVNFQDQTTNTPTGWLADFGQPYGSRTSANQGSGNTYGWVKKADGSAADLTANGRNRGRLSDTLLSTLMHMQTSSSPEGVWEAQVANGKYDVTISVGDIDYFDSRHTINIEGTPAISNFIPTLLTRFKTATITVNVTDGRLTVDAIGGRNTKLNYVIIHPNTDASLISDDTVVVEEENTEASTSARRITTAQEVAEAPRTIITTKPYPNPSTSNFSLYLQSSSSQPFNIYVYDLSGRIVENRISVGANSTIQFGQNLPTGTYFVQAVQGKEKTQTKVVKM